MTQTPPSPRARLVEGVKAPMPFLCIGRPYDGFTQLRQVVVDKTGHDFLGVCGDLMRDRNFHSTKPGVAERSYHKTGRAFDYNQGDPNVVLVQETIGGRNYFRTFLRCGTDKDGNQLGKQMHLDRWSFKGHSQVSGYFFDFTAAAEVFGFHRIPSWRGWEKGVWNYLEFWHYQCDEGLTWDEAMAYLYPPKGAKVTPEDKPTKLTQDQAVYGLNDRGPNVVRIQKMLAMLTLLEPDQVDGVFGAHTRAATLLFQEKYSHEHADAPLTIDGKVGPATMKALTAELEAK